MGTRLFSLGIPSRSRVCAHSIRRSRGFGVRTGPDGSYRTRPLWVVCETAPPTPASCLPAAFGTCVPRVEQRFAESSRPCAPSGPPRYGRFLPCSWSGSGALSLRNEPHRARWRRWLATPRRRLFALASLSIPALAVSGVLPAGVPHEPNNISTANLNTQMRDCLGYQSLKIPTPAADTPAAARS